MKSIFTILTISFLAIFTSCTTNEASLEKLLNKNPEIISKLIEKNPKLFLQSLQKASMAYQKEMREAQRPKGPLKVKIDPKRVYKGEESAQLVIVEYSDFQCYYCAKSYPVINQLLKEYKGKVKLLYKHLPIRNHPLAMPAALRYEALAKQSKKMAIAFHDKIFEEQQAFNQGKIKYLDDLAKKLGANMQKYKTALASNEVKAIVQSDMVEAGRLGFSGTPGFVVGDQGIYGYKDFNSFKKIIEAKLK